MKEIDKLVRKNVLDMHPYSSARDEYQGKYGIFLDANENPFGTLNRYPDPRHNELRDLLAQRKGIGKEKIFLGNGSDEIIDLCFRIFCNPGIDKAMIFSPTYGMYEVAASMNDVAVIDVPLLQDFSVDIQNAEKYFNDPNLKLMFICSPNNPTGNCFRENDIMYLIKNFQGIVIIDEAYIDFAGRASYISLTAEYENLIIMQTFSKAMGLASVRVGACYSNPQIVKYLFRMKPPYNISTLNQQAALKRLKESYSTSQEVTMIKNEREKLSVSLRRVKNVKRVYPSDSNFILAEVTDPDRIYNLLVDEGIIVRNRNSVVPGCLRITVGTPSENERLLDALNRIVL